MKKKIISIMAVITLLFGSMFITQGRAQIFILDDEEAAANGRSKGSGFLGLPYIPVQGSTNDQFAPLGGEVLVLSCLGGAYLLLRKRKKEE